MRKFLIGLGALLLAFVFIAPDFASADVKHLYIIRYRGMTGDDLNERDEGSRNSDQRGDWLVRPRWTYTSEGGKVWAIYELDFLSGGIDYGATTSRPAVGVNRWLVDFAVPGTTLRARFGKTDWTGPHKTGEELIGGAGLSRTQGYGVYGKLFGPLSFELWTSKFDEGGVSAFDHDLYLLSVSWKIAPAITLTPWIAFEHDNGAFPLYGNTPPAVFPFNCPSGIGRDCSGSNINSYLYALTFVGKFGIASVEATGVLQDGELNTPLGDFDLKAWAALLRLWLNFGKLKVGFYGSWMSGDDDTDNDIEIFTTPRGGAVSRLDGPQLFTRRRYHTFASGYNREARSCAGGGGRNANGCAIYEVLAHYQLTKQLLLMGNASLIRSDARRAGSGFVSDKDIGTELDVSGKYYLYKNLFMMLTFAYMVAGDYGKSSASGTQDFEDSWALFYEMRLTFKE